MEREWGAAVWQLGYASFWHGCGIDVPLTWPSAILSRGEGAMPQVWVVPGSSQQMPRGIRSESRNAQRIRSHGLLPARQTFLPLPWGGGVRGNGA